MIYQYNFLEWEVTTACNAACPQCPRNYYGGKTWENLPIVQNNLAWAKKHLPNDFIQQLQRIDFCGTYGDPIINNEFLEIVRWLRDVHPELIITVKTNGGLRDSSWWTTLAQLLGSNGSVFFGIDGLADTNHLYRRNVDFNRVIENAQTFIQAGGVAYWNYLVFKHNQHQVDQARTLSEELGFQDFNVKLTSRFFNKNHQLVDSQQVYNDKGQPEYLLEMPSNPKYVNESYSKIDFTKNFAGNKIEPKCQQRQRIYLSAEGYVFPCGWLHDRMYGFEAEQHQDREQLFKLFELAGGKDMANVNHTPIDDIVNGAWFQTVVDSWTNNHRLNRCEVMCGSNMNLIKDQNRLVNTF